eukprot:gene20340-22342_t
MNYYFLGRKCHNFTNFVILLIIVVSFGESLGDSSLQHDKKLDFQRSFIALEKAVEFYSKHFNEVNLDSIFGLRLCQGALHKAILLSKRKNENDENLERIESLHKTASNAAQNGYKLLESTKSDYFEKFKFLIDEEWIFMLPYRFIDKSIINENNKLMEDSLDETQSDVCMTDLVGNSKYASSISCLITKHCWKIMTEKFKSGYHLTHQALFMMLAEKQGCRSNVVEKLGSEDKLDEHMRYLGSNIFYQLDQHYNHGFLDDEGDKDLFAEQVVVCQMLGIINCFDSKYLKLLLEWQSAIGCWKEANDNDDGDSKNVKKLGGVQQRSNNGNTMSNSIRRSSRKLNEEKILSGGCASHFTGVATGAVSMFEMDEKTYYQEISENAQTILTMSLKNNKERRFVYGLSILQLVLLAELFWQVEARPRHDADIDDVLDSLEKAIGFYYKNYDEVNVDSIFGVRVAEGSLSIAIKLLKANSPSSDRLERVEKVYSMVLDVAGKGYEQLKASKTDYFKAFKNLIDKPWLYTRSFIKADRLVGNAKEFDNDEVFNGVDSDACFSNLIGTNANSNEEKKCIVTDTCLDLMTDERATGYYLTHQALYMALAEQQGEAQFELISRCQKQKFRKFESAEKWDQHMHQIGSKIHNEMVQKYKDGFPPNTSKDLFVEQVVVCQMLGIIECFEEKYFALIAKWQEDSGCWKEPPIAHSEEIISTDWPMEAEVDDTDRLMKDAVVVDKKRDVKDIDLDLDSFKDVDKENGDETQVMRRISRRLMTEKILSG